LVQRGILSDGDLWKKLRDALLLYDGVLHRHPMGVYHASANHLRCVLNRRPHFQYLGFFKSRAFDIYDSTTGHRVFGRDEIRVRERCKTNPYAAKAEWTNEECTRNFTTPISPGACTTRVDRDFTINLADLYDLPLGEYVIHLRPEKERIKNICAAAEEHAFVPSPADLHFAVVRP